MMMLRKDCVFEDVEDHDGDDSGDGDDNEDNDHDNSIIYFTCMHIVVR
jgi:hypothetical protein